MAVEDRFSVTTAEDIVSDGRVVLEPVERSGDEPQLLARTLAGVPVLVGADRHATGTVAQSRFDSTVFLLDEYVGLPAGHPQSYRATIYREVTDDLGIDRSRPGALVRAGPGSGWSASGSARRRIAASGSSPPASPTRSGYVF